MHARERTVARAATRADLRGSKRRGPDAAVDDDEPSLSAVKLFQALLPELRPRQKDSLSAVDKLEIILEAWSEDLHRAGKVIVRALCFHPASLSSPTHPRHYSLPRRRPPTSHPYAVGRTIYRAA